MTPQARRALLQLLESLFITSLISGLLTATDVIDTNGKLNWSFIALVTVISFVFSLAHGVAAYFKTQPDQQEQLVGAAVDAFIAALEKRYGTATLQNEKQTYQEKQP